MSLGKMEAFDIRNGCWTTYIDRLEQYFLVNNVAEERKVPLLITLMGPECYELLLTLCTPNKPASMKYTEIQSLISGHLQPKPSVLAERYKFRQRKQSRNESIADYLAELKRLSRFCDFGTWLEDSIRDQFVCGLYSDSIRLRLFTEVDLKLEKAKNLAIIMEAAEKNAAAVEDRSRRPCGDVTASSCFAVRGENGTAKPERERRFSNDSRVGPRRNDRPRASTSYNEHSRAGSGLQRINGGRGNTADYDKRRTYVGQGQGREQCMVCGRGHPTETCKFKHYVCRVCNQDGHLKKMCPRLTTYYVTHNSDERVSGIEEDDLEVNLSFVKENTLSIYKPYMVLMNVNNKKISMEIDTGSTISCISLECYENMFKNCELLPSNLRLRYYTGETVDTIGKIKPLVKYKNITKPLDLYVINNGKTNLLGRQWLVELEMDNRFDLNLIKTSQTFNISEFSSRFKDVFADGLGTYNGGLVSLRVRPDARPVFLRARPLAYALRAPVERELERLQREGIITPVETSDWATPIVPVVKADGTIRICGDYKITLNKHLDVDRFPLPRVEDLFTKLHGGQRFTKIDLSQAYAQLVLDETSKYTVITTHKGLFKFNRLVYGISSSPGIFQRILEQMFADLPRVGVFLDDVVISGIDNQDHIKNLYTVFERLEKYGLKIKKEKCSFLADSITYLGYVVNRDGLQTCPDKIKDILQVTTPKTVSELRSFIGMAMYYARFVKNISTILSPLYKLLKNNVTFKWSEECESAFNTVKKLLGSSKVLVHYAPERPLVLTTDASSVGLGAVIAHVMPDGSERPVAYASRVLNKAEKAYSQIEKEALAIIYGVKKFHQYLYGRRFVLRTDHKPLVTIFGDKAGIPVMAASRMQRWAIILAGYQYDIEYVSTSNNSADALSRLPPEVAEETPLNEYTYLNFVQDFMPLTSKDIRKYTERDEVLRQVILNIKRGWPNKCSDVELKPYFNRNQELYIEGGCVMWGYRIVVPKLLQSEILKELHASHKGMVKMKSIARGFVWWPGIDQDIEKLSRDCVICAMEAIAPPRSHYQPWPYYKEPWSRLHIDFLGPYEGKTFFVIIDSTTKWIEAFLMHRTTATAVIKVLRETFARFGLPKEIVSDNGPPFTSQELDNFNKLNGIKHIFTAPYHPASNGAAEGAVKLCKRAIKKAIRENQDLETALHTFLLNYRNCEQATTGESPAMLLQKRPLRSRLDLLRHTNTVEERVHRSQRKQIEQAGGYHRDQIKQGDPVWIQEFNGRERWVPGIIEEEKGTRHYEVRRENGNTSKRHINQLKKRFIHGPYSVPSPLDSTITLPGDTSPQSPLPQAPPAHQSPPCPGAADVAQAPAAMSGAPALPPARPLNSKRIRKPPLRFGFEIDYLTT